MEQGIKEHERYTWNILYPYRYFIAAAVVLVLGSGMGLPLILCKPLQNEENFHSCLEHLYFLSGWFYSVTAFFTFFAVLAAAFFAYGQMKSVQEQLSQNALTNYIQQRPWLTISDINQENIFDESEKRYPISYKILNFGQSPALNISIYSTTFIDMVPQEPEPYFVQMIFPHREYVHWHMLNSEQYAYVKEGVKTVEILVILNYTDSENIPHYTTEKMLIYNRLADGREIIIWKTQDADSNTPYLPPSTETQQ